MTIGMKKLSSKTLKKVYNRHYQLLGCFNYERQMSTGYAWTMMPAIRELYGEDEAKMKAGVKRHLEFFNCATTPSPFIIGITCAMEEQCASAPDGEFDVASINSVKAALMGPLAGIGDSFFWGTFRVIACGIGAPLAAAGNLLGVVLYLVLNLLPSTLTRVYGFKLGYQGGREFLAKIQADGTLEKVTEAAKILGLVVIGGLVPAIVAGPVSLGLNMGGGSFILADVLNSIMPNLLPLVLSVVVYHYIQKGVSVNKLLFLLLGLGILLTAVGFFPMG
mgnify:CR=1 FL=1